MVKVKICGLTRHDDIEIVNDLMPDYIGFVFSNSKRKVSLELAAELSKKLDSSIRKVGVFVNEELDFVRKAAEMTKLDVIQLHGQENQEYIENIKDNEVWKAIGVKDANDLKEINKYNVDGILLDSRVDGRTGGTGVAFDWNIIRQLSRNRIILAGGLDFANVRRAISIVNPYIVDVSSGVEVNGKKDYESCKKFIDEVRRA